VPVSYALTGPVAKALGTQQTLIGAGLLGGAVTLAFLFIPGMRDLERRGVLRGVHLDSGVEGALEAEGVPGAMPPTEAPEPVAAAADDGGGAPRHLRPVEDPPVEEPSRTLADLRATLARWRASRGAVGAELEELEAEEARLEHELALVRGRLTALRASREHLDAANGHGSHATVPVRTGNRGDLREQTATRREEAPLPGA
jgi:hypothetical protein